MTFCQLQLDLFLKVIKRGLLVILGLLLAAAGFWAITGWATASFQDDEGSPHAMLWWIGWFASFPVSVLLTRLLGYVVDSIESEGGESVGGR